MRCPSEAALAELATPGPLTAPGAARRQLRLRRHVGECARCAATLEAVTEARGMLARARAAEVAPDWARVEAKLPWRTGTVERRRRTGGLRLPALLAVSFAGAAAAAAAILVAFGPSDRVALSIAERVPAHAPTRAPLPGVIIPPRPTPLPLVPTVARGDVRVLHGAAAFRLGPQSVVAEGARVETGAGAVSLQWAQGSGLSLAPRSELVVRSLDPRQVQLELVRGRVVLHVAKLPPDAPRPAVPRLVVASAGLAVEVRGTVLEVARASAGAEVLVREGRVDVRRGALQTHVGAGERGRFGADDAPAAVEAATPAELASAERADTTVLLPSVSTESLAETAIVRVGAGRRVDLDGVALGGAPLWTRVSSGRHLVAVEGRGRWVRAQRGEEIDVASRAAESPVTQPIAPVVRGRVTGAGAMNERASEALACYERLGLGKDASLEGVVELQLDVAADGRVRAARVGESTLGAPAVDRCLADSALGWTVPGTGTPRSLQYWITLSRRD